MPRTARPPHGEREGIRIDGFLVVVTNAEPATQVHVAQRDAVGFEPVDEFEHLPGGLRTGRDFGDLRADVAVDTVHRDTGKVGGAPVESERVFEGDTELALLETGRDVGVRFRVDVGIHPQRNRGDLACASGDRIQRLELGGRLDVEAPDAGRQRGFHFDRRLADAGEHDLRRIAAGGDDPRQLAAGNDVEAASEAREDVQYSQVGIRLDGVANEMGNAVERGREGAKPILERRARIDIARGAETLGERRQRHALGVEFAVDAGKCGHGRVSCAFGGDAAGDSVEGAGGESGRRRAGGGCGCRRQLQRALHATRAEQCEADRCCDKSGSDHAKPGDEIT